MIKIERSGPAILAALAQHAPEDCARCETELREALVRAVDSLDLAEAQSVLTRWHLMATVAAIPLTPDQRAQLERARAGDFTGLYNRAEHGTWEQL